MHAHNHFTIRADKTQTVFNTVNSLSDGYRTGRPVTAFMAILQGGTVKHVLPVTTVSYNADINKGALYVTRGAVLDTLTAGEGEAFDGVGFTPDASGNVLINVATFEPVRATAGKPIYMTGTLYLDAAQTGAGTLVAGDNPLIRAFLGLDGLNIDAFTLCKGFSRHPNVPVYSDSARLTALGPCNASFTGTTLTLSAVGSGSTFEALICYAGAPVLRYYDSRVFSAEPISLTTDAGGYVYLGADRLSVMDIRVNGMTVGFSSYLLPERYVECCPALFEAALPANPTVTGEPTGNAAAVSGDRQTLVLIADGNTVRECMRVPEAGKTSVVTDGTLFLASGGKLIVYVPEADGYRTIRPDFASVTAVAATGAGTDGAYFVCVISDNRLCQYRLQNDTFTQLAAPRVAQNATLHAFTSRLIVCLNKTFGAAALSAAGESTALSNMLKTLTSVGSTEIGFNGMMMNVRQGIGALCDVISSSAMPVSAEPVVFLRQTALIGEKPYAKPSGLALSVLPADASFSGVTQGASIGRYILLIRNGRAEFVYESPGRLALCLPDHPNTTITGMTVLRAPAWKNISIHADLTFNA